MKRETIMSAVATAAALLLLLQLIGTAGAEAALKATVSVSPAVATETNVHPDQKYNLEHKQKLFLANYATSTELRLSLTTSTEHLSCLAAFDSMVCAGRSARLLRNRNAFVSREGDASALDGSLSETKEEARADSNSQSVGSEDATVWSVGSEDAKKFFTVWSVAYSTATLTTTYTDSSITVSLSAMCIPAGGKVPPLCPG